MTIGMLRALQRSITIEIRASIDWFRPKPGPAESFSKILTQNKTTEQIDKYSSVK
jgi:hypothetical protein